MNPVLEKVTERIERRSEPGRGRYLGRIRDAGDRGPSRKALSCSNLAHGFAACATPDKQALAGTRVKNIGIVSAYNDMLSAHQPFESYPQVIREAAQAAGAVAQFAGGVPAMCDGVTQGQPGMELSLFSRDVIAMATGVALSHNMFDAAICLGVCDKIIPGLLIGALSFGHLPVVFAPAGPMPSGLPNNEKARVREAFAAGEIGRDELLQAESASYHSAGTCTFYGTANSNQMLMEFLGLQLPGGSFVNPGTPLRDALTRAAVDTVLADRREGHGCAAIGDIVNTRSIVNALVGLLATGGSTNHTIHLVAVARAAGITIDWDDFAELSAVVPLMARVYPNGQADVNHFHAAGGLGFVLGDLLEAGLLHEDVDTILGRGLSRFCVEPFLDGGKLGWRSAQEASGDLEILRPAHEPFDSEGGLKLLQGNLGRAIVKVSSVDPGHRRITAPARVFDSQSAFVDAFNRGAFDEDCVVVVTHQGPSSNGMPELHKLTPYLKVLQSSGLKVALLTDGRMSGASGAVLAAIHVSPDTLGGGLISRVRDGDPVEIDAHEGRMTLHVEEQALAQRKTLAATEDSHFGTGRELFEMFRRQVSDTEAGATVFPGVQA